MNNTKKLIVAALVALAVTASLGAGTASATRLCKSVPSSGQCPTEDRYGVGTELKMQLQSGTEAIITHGAITDKCKLGTLNATVSDEGGNAGTHVVKAESTALTFGSCGCKYETFHPGQFSVDWWPSYKGILQQEGIEFSQNCSGMTCIYYAPAGSFKGYVSWLNGGNPAIVAEHLLLARSGGNAGWCGNTAELTLNYEVTSPKPLYVADY